MEITNASQTNLFEGKNTIDYKKQIKSYVPKPEQSIDTSSDLRQSSDGDKSVWIPEKERVFKSDFSQPVSVFDVAAYILKKLGPMPTMKLQKLVYYCQAWSLVWDEAPLFKEPIEAWANGPVVKDLFSYHRGIYSISSVPIGNPDLLSEVQRETIDAVLDFYGKKSSQWLIDLSHIEEPWRKARVGLPDLDRGNREITLDSMAEYYSSLP
jgi:uncharacterized phage-associated protein